MKLKKFLKKDLESLTDDNGLVTKNSFLVNSLFADTINLYSKIINSNTDLEIDYVKEIDFYTDRHNLSYFEAMKNINLYSKTKNNIYNNGMTYGKYF